MIDGAGSDGREPRRLVGVWSMDVASELVVADGMVCEYFNVDPAQGLRGAPLRKYLDAVSADDRDELQRLIRIAVGSDGPFVASYRVESVLHGSQVILARGRCFRNVAGHAVHLSGYVETSSVEASEGAPKDSMRMHLELVEHLVEARLRAVQLEADVLEKLISAVMLEAGYQLASQVTRESGS